jgi:histone-lysine N-methyltransferase SETD8
MDCVLCGKTYKNDSSLRKHRSVVHGKSSTKVCKNCNSSFGANNFAKHVRLCTRIKIEMIAHPKSPEKREKRLKPKSLEAHFSEIGMESDFQIVQIPNKGRGIIAKRNFLKGDWVLEYKGKLLTQKEADAKNLEYSEDPKIGSYMFSFKANNKRFCIDATAETGDKGRLVNHSFKNPNLQPKVVFFSEQPRLILVALHNIHIGEELLYDYGDRSAQTIEENPWLKSS